MADRPPAYVTGDPLITEVSIRMFPSGNLRAFVDITLLGHFVIKGCKIQDSAKGIWVSMPSEKDPKTGKYIDTFFPITPDARTRIQTLVLNAYQQAAQGVQPSGAPPPDPIPLRSGSAATAAPGSRPSLFSVLRAWFKGEAVPSSAAPTSAQTPALSIPAFTGSSAIPGAAPAASPWSTATPSAPAATPWGAPATSPAPASPPAPTTPMGEQDARAPNPPSSTPWGSSSNPPSSTPWGKS